MNRNAFVNRGRPRVGAPIGPDGSFPLASGGMPRLTPGVGGRGTRQPLPFPVANFPASTAAGAGTEESNTTSQGIFRPSRLIVAVADTSLGTSIAITSIFVGSESCLVNNNPLTAAIFQATGVDCEVTFPTADPGITIALSFANVTAIASTTGGLNVLPAMLGEYIQGGGRHIVG
jgi:hypothetical protein